MKLRRGSIVLLVVCLNIWLTFVGCLCVQIVGLARTLSSRFCESYKDDCRFEVLTDLARRYIKLYPQDVFFKGVIFDDEVLLEGVDAFKGKIEFFVNDKAYNTIITINVNQKEKIIKKKL